MRWVDALMIDGVERIEDETMEPEARTGLEEGEGVGVGMGVGGTEGGVWPWRRGVW